jgi:energy-coupling factor transporter transmembrane protein EcfT
VPYKGFPQPWRGWLLALLAVIFALIVVQWVVGGGWVLLGVVLVLIAIQFGLARYARRQM